MVYLPGVMNTANSLVGSGMLAMPFIVMKCGIILGPLLFVVSAWVCEKACHLLVVLAKASQRESYDEVGKAVFGRPGQRACQFAMALSMTNGMVVWFVVLGDIIPRLCEKYGLIDDVTPSSRAVLLVIVAVCVVFPVSLQKNVMGSIALLSKASVTFYFCFILWVCRYGFSTVADMEWIAYVPWFDLTGIPACIPIATGAMTAQTQFFLIYQNMPNNSVAEMRSCVKCACVIVWAGYTTVGLFGYAAVAGSVIPADVIVAPNIMAHFTGVGVVSDIFQFGFATSIVMSYPLQVLPACDIFWSLYRPDQHRHQHNDMEIGEASALKRQQMPDSYFFRVTAALVCGSLIIAICVPRMDAIYMLSGATGNCTVAFFLPTICYLVWEDRYPRSVQNYALQHGVMLRQLAKMIFLLGCFVSMSGLVNGFGILLSGPQDAASAEPVPVNVVVLSQAALRLRLSRMPINSLVHTLETHGVDRSKLDALLRAEQPSQVALPLWRAYVDRSGGHGDEPSLHALAAPLMHDELQNPQLGLPAAGILYKPKVSKESQENEVVDDETQGEIVVQEEDAAGHDVDEQKKDQEKEQEMAAALGEEAQAKGEEVAKVQAAETSSPPVAAADAAADAAAQEKEEEAKATNDQLGTKLQYNPTSKQPVSAEPEPEPEPEPKPKPKPDLGSPRNGRGNAVSPQPPIAPRSPPPPVSLETPAMVPHMMSQTELKSSSSNLSHAVVPRPETATTPHHEAGTGTTALTDSAADSDNPTIFKQLELIVVVPEGAVEGQRIQFTSPSGDLYQVVVPPGATPGQYLTVAAAAPEQMEEEEDFAEPEPESEHVDTTGQIPAASTSHNKHTHTSPSSTSMLMDHVGLELIVVVPQGAVVGQRIQFTSPSGHLYEVIVPQGATAGQHLKVALARSGTGVGEVDTRTTGAQVAGAGAAVDDTMPSLPPRPPTTKTMPSAAAGAAGDAETTAASAVAAGAESTLPQTAAESAPVVAEKAPSLEEKAVQAQAKAEQEAAVLALAEAESARLAAESYHAAEAQALAKKKLTAAAMEAARLKAEAHEAANDEAEAAAAKMADNITGHRID